jgi:hypothetical protein
VWPSSAAISFSDAGSKIAIDSDSDPSDARFTPIADLVERTGALKVTEPPDRRTEECHQDQCAVLIHEQPAIAGSIAFGACLQVRKSRAEQDCRQGASGCNSMSR